MSQANVGGYGPTEDVIGIQSMCDQVRSVVEGITNHKYDVYKAEKYRIQIVAGTNFLIKVFVGDGQYLHLMIFQSLSQLLKLRGVQQHKSKEDPLVPFDTEQST